MEVLTTKEVIPMLKCSESTFYKTVQFDPDFPKAKKLHANARMKLYLKAEIEKYIAKRFNLV